MEDVCVRRHQWRDGWVADILDSRDYVGHNGERTVECGFLFPSKEEAEMAVCRWRLLESASQHETQNDESS